MTLPFNYRPAELHGSTGPVIVLEGVSGVGKSTLSEALERRLSATRLHTLPLPHSTWTTAVNARLAPLPQFTFYLSGALHASDIIRRSRMIGPVVADRYVSSVIACHAAVHEISVETVARMVEPYLSYFVAPDFTFYLRCTETELRKRLASKDDLTRDDSDLFSVSGRLARLLENFERVAGDDRSAVILETDGRSTDDLGQWITSHLEAQGA